MTRWKIGPVWTDAQSPVPQAYVESPPPPDKPCDQRCTDCAVRGCLAALEPAEVAAAVGTLLRV